MIYAVLIVPLSLIIAKLNSFVIQLGQQSLTAKPSSDLLFTLIDSAFIQDVFYPCFIMHHSSIS